MPDPDKSQLLAEPETQASAQNAQALRRSQMGVKTEASPPSDGVVVAGMMWQGSRNGIQHEVQSQWRAHEITVQSIDRDSARKGRPSNLPFVFVMTSADSGIHSVGDSFPVPSFVR